MKKFEKLLIFIMALMLCAINVSAAQCDFSIIDLTVTDASGNNAEYISSGAQSYNVNITLKNNSSESSECVLIGALYSENNTLKSISVSDKYLLSSGQTKNIHFAVNFETSTQDGDVIKIMSWNADSTRPVIKNITALKSKNTVSAQTISAVNGFYTDMEEIGLKHARIDFSWNSVEPQKGVFDEAVMKERGDKILTLKAKGETVVPILDYTADWAVNPDAYSYNYDYNGTVVYNCSAAKQINGSGWYRDITVVKNGVVQEVKQNVSRSKSKEPFKDVNDWKTYVEKIVSTYSAPPYNVEYFQVWNEAYPNSSFFHGDMKWYIQNVHKPAAEIIRKYGCKVVYGGWPVSAPLDIYAKLLEDTDAWHTIDVFDIHYFGSKEVRYVYEQALKNGVVSPCVWMTEVGFTTKTEYIPRNYPLFLYEALNMQSDKQNQFRYYYFTYRCPDSSAAYGYGATLYHAKNLTGHGKAMKTFIDLLSGDNVQRYTTFDTQPYIGYTAKPGKCVAGFNVDSNKAIVWVSADNIADVQEMKLQFDGITDIKKATLVDVYGDNNIDLTWNPINDNEGYVNIPGDYEKSVFYVVVEAGEVNPPKNNIKDYNYGSDNWGRSIITPGKWSYVDSNFSPLYKGTGAGTFGTNEWCSDNTKSEHTGYVDNSGNVATEGNPIYYNYTMPEDAENVTVDIKVTSDDTNKKVVIYKTNEQLDYYVGESELVCQLSFSGDDECLVKIDGVKSGNDILIGIVGTDNQPISANMDITIK